MKKILTILLVFIMGINSVLAINTLNLHYFDDESSANVNGVDVIAFSCTTAACSNIFNQQGSIINTGITNDAVLQIGAVSQQTNFVAYSFVDGYLPHYTTFWFNGNSANIDGYVNLEKKDFCTATIDSFTITNTAQPYYPVQIDVETSLTAETYSAFSFTDSPVVPFGADDSASPFYDFYTADTDVTLQIEDPDGNIVLMETQNIAILADDSETVSFTWTPTDNPGEYTATVFTSVDDLACENTNTQYAQSEFEVINTDAASFCYTLLNDLSISDPYPIAGQTYGLSVEKISNAADEDNLLVSLPTMLTVDAYNELGQYVQTIWSGVVPANAGSTVAESVAFTWTPAQAGNALIVANGVAQSCPYTDNFDATQAMYIYVASGENNEPPFADPAGPYTADVNEEILFFGENSYDIDGTIEAYEWNFGNGDTAAVENPFYAYDAEGVYTVTLTVTDNEGVSATATTTAIITAGNQLPVAEITGNDEALVGESLPLAGVNSYDPDGSIVSYSWDFDGRNGIQVDATGAITSILYTVPGAYVITLTVTDNDGAAAVDTHEVTVAENQDNQVPVAVINAPTMGVTNQLVSFDATASSDSDGFIATYSWDFNAADGLQVEATTAAATVVYTMPGIYVATVTVTDNEGAVASASHQIIISDAPNQAPVVQINGPYNGLQYDPVQFSSAGSVDIDGTIVSYFWDFGDGFTSNEADPEHAYTAVGSYVVMLTVTDNSGASSIAATYAAIDVNPAYVDISAEAVISASPTSGEQDILVHFSGVQSIGNVPLTYSWDFGDGYSATGVQVNHWYHDQGTFTASLTITDLDGDSSTTSVDIVVDEDVEFENLASRHTHINSVRFLNDDVVQAGNAVGVYVNVENIGVLDKIGEQIKISIPELGVYVTSEPFEFDVGERGKATLFVEIPANTPPGVYTARIIVSDDAVQRIIHREVIVR